MKHALLFVTVLPFSMLNAQPMSGNFIVGGESPDFTTLQDAAIALKQRGVFGPVFFNIRPDIYMQNGGNNTVLRLDTLVTGVSAANRITFQPDAASRGNLDNVILQFNRTNPATADRDLVHIRLDFVTTTRTVTSTLLRSTVLWMITVSPSFSTTGWGTSGRNSTAFKGSAAASRSVWWLRILILTGEPISPSHQDRDRDLIWYSCYSTSAEELPGLMKGQLRRSPQSFGWSKTIPIPLTQPRRSAMKLSGPGV